MVDKRVSSKMGRSLPMCESASLSVHIYICNIRRHYVDVQRRSDNKNLKNMSHIHILERNNNNKGRRCK